MHSVFAHNTSFRFILGEMAHAPGMEADGRADSINAYA